MSRWDKSASPPSPLALRRRRIVPRGGGARWVRNMRWITAKPVHWTSFATSILRHIWFRDRCLAPKMKKRREEWKISGGGRRGVSRRKEKWEKCAYVLEFYHFSRHENNIKLRGNLRIIVTGVRDKILGEPPLPNEFVALTVYLYCRVTARRRQ